MPAPPDPAPYGTPLEGGAPRTLPPPPPPLEFGARSKAHRRRPEYREAPYAGFWRRAGGLLLDLVMLAVIGVVIRLVSVFLYGWVTSLRTDCVMTWDVYLELRPCGASTLGGWALVTVAGLVWLLGWYRLIPRAVAFHGHSFGMRQMGLRARVVTLDRDLDVGTAVARAALQVLIFGLAAGAGAVLVWFASGDWPWDGSTVMLVASLAAGPVVLQCWSLLNRRRQTLYDAASGAVVLRYRDINWLAVLAFVCTLTVVLIPVGIVLGHVASRKIQDSRNHQAGGGLATLATSLGYLAILVGVAVGAWVVIGDRGDERDVATPVVVDPAADRVALEQALPQEQTSGDGLKRLGLLPDQGICGDRIFEESVAKVGVEYADPMGLNPVGMAVQLESFPPDAVPDDDGGARDKVDSCAPFTRNEVITVARTNLSASEVPGSRWSVGYEVIYQRQPPAVMYVTVAQADRVAATVVSTSRQQSDFVAAVSLSRAVGAIGGEQADGTAARGGDI